MIEQRAQDSLDAFRAGRVERARAHYEERWGWIKSRAVLDDVLPPERTINRIPKVEWP